MTTSATPAAPQQSPRIPRRERLRPYLLGGVVFLALLAVTVAFVALVNSVHSGKVAARASQATADQAKAIADLANQLGGENASQLRTNARLLCGGFVPISKVVLPPSAPPLGRSVVTWARTSADILNCPGR